MSPIPHTQPANWPADMPPTKLASAISHQPDGCAIALLGVPDDTGVGLNHGRPGAAKGPDALRQALARYGVAQPHAFDWPRIWDAGDVRVAKGELETTHQRLTEASEAIARMGILPVMIGGGHDLTFPFVRGVANATSPMHGIYFDAHLDVRAETGSGMPFRRLIESGAATRLSVHGLDPYANSRAHTDWFLAHNGHLGTRPPEEDWPDEPTFVSLDMDVFDCAFAPGVSAHNPCGWAPELGERWAYRSGRNPRVRCFDIMELSPPHDQDGRTARLAARMLLAFLRGYSERHAS